MNICRPIILHNEFLPACTGKRTWEYRAFGHYDGITVKESISVESYENLRKLFAECLKNEEDNFMYFSQTLLGFHEDTEAEKEFWKYQFNVTEEKYAYLNDINQLNGFDQKKREMIEKLVEILHKQKHGTVAIVFAEGINAGEEADRLCKKKRGTRIGESICYDAEKGCWGEEQILAVSGIDGALFIDYHGKCLAIGVIVDGEAVETGNVGRGARYNSIVNYMKLHPGCVGIVVSEDGMIDVIQKNE